MKTLFGRALLGLCCLCVSASSLAATNPAAASTAAPAPSRRMELQLSWGLRAVDADRTYRRGGAGAGVVVAMIDTGLDEAARALFARISPASTDLIPHRVHGDAGADHGRLTATVLAAARDGLGTMGIAYDIELLAIRADQDGSCRTLCSMTQQNVARGIDYAVAHGARIIGLPIAATHPLPIVAAALERATKAGALIVAAAGNDGGAEPVWPARYAADPRFHGAILVAGASLPNRLRAPWSNQAGSVADYYLMAPGDDLLVDCDPRYCTKVSGTSYSVSYVAGAAALLLGRHPRLSAERAAQLLLRAARDGDQPLPASGRGLLNVSRAARLAEKLTG